jgi:TolA-binding protein
MKKVLIFISVFLLADVDPFNTPNNPKYLTHTEKMIYYNRKSINKLKKRISRLEFLQAKKFSEYDLQFEKLINKASSFTTLVDSINNIDSKVVKIKLELKKEISKNQKEIEKNKETSKLLLEKVSMLENEISILKKSIKELSEIQNKNFLTLKNLILKKLSKPKKKSLKEILNDARKAFEDGEYDKAKKLFTYTYQKGYKTATSLFYLGEVAYVQRLYKDALGFYKKSVQVYPKKTSYMDRLLYHTGRSFMKLGEKELAVLTFKKLIKEYPTSLYVKFAKKDLEKLK